MQKGKSFGGEDGGRREEEEDKGRKGPERQGKKGDDWNVEDVHSGLML